MEENQGVTSLTPFGAQVVAAKDGEEGVLAYEAERPDCILMDMQMPRVDGLEATRRIRAIEEVRNIPRTPIIMVTANALTAHHDMAIAAGVDMTVTKPVGLSALIGAIETMLSRPLEP